MARAPSDGAIAERARKSLGLLTIPQLDAMGVTRQRRRTLVARGTLVPLGRGVFRHCAWSGSWERLVLAAVLEAGPSAVASHLAAAALWRFEGMGAGHSRSRCPPAGIRCRTTGPSTGAVIWSLPTSSRGPGSL
jgi:hypothetical protein